MEYYVADSYTNWDRVGEPFDKNGKLYTLASTKCGRCYNGKYISRVENGVPIPHPAYNGVCLACDGTGYATKEIRLYTQKEKDAAARSKQRVAERKELEREAAASKKKEEWLKKEKFNSQGVTAIYVASDSYEIKDTLKANGWKYSPIVGWHTTPEEAIEQGLEEKTLSVAYKYLVSFTDGHAFWLDTAKTFVDDIRNNLKPHLSEWIGEVGERLFDVPVVISYIGNCETMFGWISVITFLDGNNILTWLTSTSINFEKGDKCYLTATVKSHGEYKGNKTTTITRARLTKREE